MGEVFGAFLKLGLTSFGGPIAHLAYFRREFVERRKWLDDSQYAQLLALCQFLPGPASSKLGFSLGLLRAGWAGALAAFVGFTLPSALLLFAFAALLPHISGAAGDAAIHGLKIVALAVVAQGVLGMIRQLCPDLARQTIATLAAVIILLSGQAWVQLAVVALGAAAGAALCRAVVPVPGGGLDFRYGAALGWTLLALFALLLVGLPFAASGNTGLIAVTEAFYRAGALVFGGGHVVLPLLEEAVVKPGWISRDEFLAGYGAAQAVPGPMFTLAAYLGARLPGAEGGGVGASLALAAIFLPGFLLIAGVLPLWRALAGRALAARAIAGVNAAVVGLLGAALYDPVWTSAVRGPADLAVALVGFALLAAWRVSALLVVLWCVAASVLLAVLN
jgi:chromate transporter